MDAMHVLCSTLLRRAWKKPYWDLLPCCLYPTFIQDDDSPCLGVLNTGYFRMSARDLCTYTVHSHRWSTKISNRECSMQYCCWCFTLSHLPCCCRANILLDHSMTAKLADLGFSMQLSRVSRGKTVFTTPGVARSQGYYPSEVTSGHFSDRSDVACFGIVSIQMLGNIPLILCSCCYMYMCIYLYM